MLDPKSDGKMYKFEKQEAKQDECDHVYETLEDGTQTRWRKGIKKPQRGGVKMTKPLSIFLQLLGAFLLFLSLVHSVSGGNGWLKFLLGVLFVVAGGIGIRKRIRRIEM